MQWQDIAISLAQWIAIVALIPSVIGNEKPALSSSLTTALAVALFDISYFTLGLYTSTISATLLLMMWLVLAYQMWRRKMLQ